MKSAMAMAFHHLLMLLDQLFRFPLRWQISELGELRQNPSRYFQRMGSARIGPGHQLTTAAFLAVFGSMVIFIIAVFVVNQSGLPWDNTVVRSLVFFGCYAASFVWFWYILRGGEILLSARGVRFQYRGIDVRCPWHFFAIEGKISRAGFPKVVFSVRPDAVPEVAAVFPDGKRLRGYEIETKPFMFAGEDLIELDDLYRCRLPAVVNLLRDVANRLESPITMTQVETPV